MGETWQLVLSNILPVVAGGAVGWFSRRQKNKADMKTKEAENQRLLKAQEADKNQMIVDLYQEALSDLKKRYDEKFGELHEEIEALRKNVELWKTKYRDLKKAFDEYRERREKPNTTPGGGE